VSGQHNAPVILPQKKNPPICIENEAGGGYERYKESDSESESVLIWLRYCDT
jgi:hypothetical protein